MPTLAEIHDLFVDAFTDLGEGLMPSLYEGTDIKNPNTYLNGNDILPIAYLIATSAGMPPDFEVNLESLQFITVGTSEAQSVLSVDRLNTLVDANARHLGDTLRKFIHSGATTKSLIVAATEEDALCSSHFAAWSLVKNVDGTLHLTIRDSIVADHGITPPELQCQIEIIKRIVMKLETTIEVVVAPVKSQAASDCLIHAVYNGIAASDVRLSAITLDPVKIRQQLYWVRSGAFLKLEESFKARVEVNPKVFDYAALIANLVKLTTDYHAHLVNKAPSSSKCTQVKALVDALSLKESPQENYDNFKLVLAREFLRSDVQAHRDPAWQRYVINSLIVAAIVLTGILPGLIVLYLRTRSITQDLATDLNTTKTCEWQFWRARGDRLVERLDQLVASAPQL